MKFVKPKVWLLGKTTLNQEAIKDYCSFHDADEYYKKHFLDENIPSEETDGAKLVMLAGKRCYRALVPKINPNVSRVRENARQYIDNILDSGHGSVIEHVVYNFGIENVSRVFTGEMNRHRAGAAISEGSMRYIRFTDIPCCETTMLDLENHKNDENVLNKVLQTRECFDRVFATVEKEYEKLEQIWASELSPESKFHYKKAVTSMMRRIVPMGVATGGVWSYNLRSLRHIFGMRCDEAAEEEILVVAVMMLELMLAADPLFFSDFKKNEKGCWRPEFWKV
jgi:thymidylate synthase (FAD)